MDSEIIRKHAAEAIGFAMSVVVIPAGVAAVGATGLVIFAVGLFGTLAFAAWAYPQWRIILALAAIAAGAFAIWAFERDVAYGLKWMLCRNQSYMVVDGDFRLESYWIGVHPINTNSFDLWAKSDEQTFTLGGKTVGGKLSDPPFRIPSHNPHFLNSTRISFDPPIKLSDAGEGTIRYVMRFGRTSENMDKTLIVSGKVPIYYLQDGTTVVGLRPDPDSSVPSTDSECDVPPL